MTVPVWPSTIPQAFVLNSYVEKGANNLIKSDNSAGPAKMRRKTTANIRQVSGDMMMDATQLATFRTFLTSSIGYGALPFTFPAQSEAGTWLVRIDPQYDLVAASPSLWRVSLKIEVLP